MRKIELSTLPPHPDSMTLIKSGERMQHKRMATALERTLSRCNEINAEYQQHTVLLRENSEKEGFAAGFELFFSQLLSMFDEYTQLQNARFAKFQHDLSTALKTSFYDPVIVDRIIHHLQEKIGHQKDLKIIIPHQVPLPDGVEISNYIFTHDDNITVQNDSAALRFPAEFLCNQWLNEARKGMHTASEKIHSLIPEKLEELGNKLIQLSQNDQYIESNDNQNEEEDEYS
ncbi:type III secretion protein [Erwinia papayae]|uniref:Type III secretion protein n=1 Tax=Erwinia papayae TaxID=206499 RepID=A0ABV3N3T3_9GAMM